MSNNLYIPFHPGDYLADTAHLTTLEHGAYFLLILNYWQRATPLPADDKKLRGIARLSADEWAEARATLLEFFDERDGLLHHKRIDEELEKARTRSEFAREKGRRSGAARKARGQSTELGSPPAEPMFNRSSTAVEPQLNPSPTNQDQEQDQVKEAASAASCTRASEADFRTSIGQLYAKHGHLPPETGTAVVWLKQGRDPQICLAVIDDQLAKRKRSLPLKYFEGPIADAHAAPPAGRPQIARASPPPRRDGWAEMYRQFHGLGEFANAGANDPFDERGDGLTIDAFAVVAGGRN